MPEVIKFAGIEGESKLKGYEGWVDISSWSFGVSHSTSGVPGGGYSTDKAHLSDITISKAGDKGSITLLQKIIFGKHFDTVDIVSLKTTGDALEPFLQVKMEHVLVTSISQVGGGSSTPMESLSMAFKKIEWIYQPQTSTGTLDPEATLKVDLETYEEV